MSEPYIPPCLLTAEQYRRKILRNREKPTVDLRKPRVPRDMAETKRPPAKEEQAHVVYREGTIYVGKLPS